MPPPKTQTAGGTPVPDIQPETATKASKATGTGGAAKAGSVTDVAVGHSSKAPDDAGTLGVAVFAAGSGDGLSVPDATPVELDEAWCRARGFSGKLGETIALPADDGTTVVAVGLGDRDALDGRALHKAASALARAASRETHLATNLASVVGGGAETAQAVIEGVLLASYRFTRHKSSSNGAAPSPSLRRLTLVGGPAGAANKAAARAKALVEGTVLARDLANEPAGTLPPRELADRAVAVGKAKGLKVTVWDEKKVAAERMGALLGVAAGADEPCRFVRIEYTPSVARPRGTLAMVGKGITFDSGGLSLKPPAGMMTMKSDMSGAAAVLGAMSAIADLAPPVRVIGYLCCTENMPSGKATRPGDVLVTRSGKTIEVLNTDAEGRLVLADGLTVAVEEQPDAVVDIATLTGAVVSALGKKVAGVMGTSEPLIDQVRAAGDRAGESYWPLPLPDEYRKQIDSDVADIKNIGAGAENGAITGGMVLKEFVGDVPWAHLDIAGTARAESDDGAVTKGCTGFGARTLAELACSFRKPSSR